MEHEIIDHTKKAYKALKNPDKHFWEKFKEIAVEVIIIVFAVSFAAFIERTREQYKEKSEAKEFVLGLRGDINNAIKTLETSKNDIDSLRNNYSFLIRLKSSSVDSALKQHGHSFTISKFNTQLNNGRYDGFKSSGKIQTIENDSLRNDILTYYEEDAPFVAFAENVFNAQQTRLEDYLLNSSDESVHTQAGMLKLLITFKPKLLLNFSMGYSDGVLRG